MNSLMYRYKFESTVEMADVESTLVLALLATECLHGASQVRLDAAHSLDLTARSCVVDASTRVGQDFNRLFVGFMARECGEDAFGVEQLLQPLPTEPVLSAV